MKKQIIPIVAVAVFAFALIFNFNVKEIAVSNAYAGGGCQVDIGSKCHHDGEVCPDEYWAVDKSIGLSASIQ